ncbi:sulfate adenylyltransferase [Corynebacterium sp. HMSC064E07]|uniref:sulfate adenylyltransferase subunit 1 n=1 Tax=Corynebacterium sp. HMSC064E07 TaxID=1739545 RepID=UPI0008A164BF|nr:GTP-binding protein [Corynebacterium sp. HMSC064E07]OFO25965.1 sulfate adenylyltransferase [Corynebacterium sp. HMSC064E07]
MSQPNSPATLITADRATRARRTLRLCTAGSVDDGKSTFVGRLLHDTKNILADQYEAVVASSQARGQENPDLSLLVDGLRAEREQGITIDVAYRYFATDVRSFILADCPGHEQYTRNTITGMSTAEAVVLLIDARNGVVTQTKRHATVAGLLGVRHVIFAVNKIDLLDYSEEAFRKIESDVAALAERLGLQNTFVVPVSALVGDNIVDSSEHTPWYEGPTVLELLENLNIGADLETDAEADLRLPIDYVIRDHATEYRGYAGRIAAGSLRVGDVVSVDANRQATVTKITVAAEDVTEAVAGQSVAISLDAEFDLARGDLISGTRPEDVRRFSAVAVHLADKPLAVGRVVEVRYGAALVRGRIASVDALIDIETGEPTGVADQLAVNDVAEITVEVAQPLPVDVYRVGGRVGAFLLIEPGTGDTLTAGLVRGAAQ